jgi:hypothetical protein
LWQNILFVSPHFLRILPGIRDLIFFFFVLAGLVDAHCKNKKNSGFKGKYPATMLSDGL